MQITRLVAKNYKTYLDLDIDLSVDKDKSIVLIAGMNNGGKTTMFEAVCGALYGLNIKTPKDFEKLVNASYQPGYDGTAQDEWKKHDIVLSIEFNGHILGRRYLYQLTRTYSFKHDRPDWSVCLKFDSSTYQYGSQTTKGAAEAQTAMVNKIIKANLPPELSKYFLFDALQTRDLVDEANVNEMIRDNIQSVMGFEKYMILKSGATRILDEERGKRLSDDESKRRYDELIATKTIKEGEIAGLKAEYDKCVLYSTQNQESYDAMMSGAQDEKILETKISSTQRSIDEIIKDEDRYLEEVGKFGSRIDELVSKPRLTDLLKEEVMKIIESKRSKGSQQSLLLEEDQINSVVSILLEVLSEAGESLQLTSEDLCERIKKKQDEVVSVNDPYAYLDSADVEALRDLMDLYHINSYIQLDSSKTLLNQRLQDLPQLEEKLESYKAQKLGTDYESIKKFEENESEIKRLKGEIDVKERELKTLNREIDAYDVQATAGGDLVFETLQKLPNLFDILSERLLENRKNSIEQRMKEELNKIMLAYAGQISRVELNISKMNIDFKIYHVRGNEIKLDTLHSASKQVLMQVLMKVLNELGDYDAPVMIDSVMANFDSEHSEAVLKYYFPFVAGQTILFSNDKEITATDGFNTLRPYLAKVYTLNRDNDRQLTTISNDYFGKTI